MRRKTETSGVITEDLALLEGAEHLNFLILVDCPDIDPERLASILKIEIETQP